MDAPAPVAVQSLGEAGPRVVLVHGSGATGWDAWPAQRPLADAHRLVVVHRSGYPPNPPLATIDFEVQAAEVASLLEAGDHLVGHSYGGVVALLAAATSGSRIASLTVAEPPAFGLVRGNADVDRLVERLAPILASVGEPRAFLVAFLAAVGSTYQPPDPLPPGVEACVRAHMAERPSWEAEIPLATIAGRSIPAMVLSGGHHPAFEAVCDAIAQGLGATRAVIPGAGHSVQRTGEPFNAALRAFIADHEPPAD